MLDSWLVSELVQNIAKLPWKRSTHRQLGSHEILFSDNSQFAFSLQEFFTEDLWHTLPSSWQPVLQDLSYPQVADLLLDAAHGDRRYHKTIIRPFVLVIHRT